MQRRRTWLGMTILGALALLTLGCSRQSPEAVTSVLRLSQRNEPATLDPAQATLPDEFFILRAVLEGLVAPDPAGGEPQPAAAERWTVSPDGLTYTFQLRANGRWSDDTPVVAADFVESYKRVLTPATAAAKADLFFHVAGAEDFYRGRITDFAQTGFSAPDERTVIIRLSRPAPEFLAYVASGPWLPVNLRTVTEHGRTWTQPGKFVGNGPFTLTAWDANQQITVRRRVDHWDAGHIKVNEIHFVALDNGDAEERAFRSGQVDITMSVPPHRIATYAAETPSRLRATPLHETRFLAFNTERGPLADARVRRALSLAVDRSAIVRSVLQGHQVPTSTYVSPSLGGYRGPTSPTGSLDEARNLLAAAGFPGGAGFPRLVVSTWTSPQVIEAIQQMWRRELGVQVDLLQREARVHLAALRSGDYDIGFMTSIPDVADPAKTLEEFRTGQPGNYPRWSSPEFDTVLASAQTAPDAATRLERLAAAEQILLEAQPVAPLYFNVKNFLISPGVKGWQEDGLWTRFYRDVSVERTP
ncbi:MAG TPA: peptide ABC transporter substrate-binding protein [Opitutaceae bacterium]